MARKPTKPVNGERTPPHSVEAEQGVLGCILLSPKESLKTCAEALKDSGVFHDLRHRAIYECIAGMHSRREPIDAITVQQNLRDNGELDAVGGVAYLASLPDATPSAANLGHYIAIVREKFRLRRLIGFCSEMVGRAYEHAGDAEPLFTAAEADFRRVFSADSAAMGDAETFDALCSFDHRRDDSTLLGVKPDGTHSRYLCRSGAGWIIGPSGVGKSSLAVMMAMLWSVGQPAFGITPTRAMRVLLVQAENDAGDRAEMIQGVRDGLGWDEFQHEKELAMVRQNFCVRTEISRTGKDFTRWLEQAITADKADIVLLDPFLSFAGFDVSKQQECTQFLRHYLNPVLHATGAAILGIHHTGKPQREMKGTRPLTALEQAYAGIGSSELVNWARLVMTLRDAGEGNFVLQFSKRGNRAWARHPSGEPTQAIWLRHSTERVFWEQQEPPQEPVEEAEEKPVKEKPKTKPEQLASSNLASFLSNCPTDGESLRAVTKRLSEWASSKEASPRLAISPASCRTALELMLNTGKLESNDGLYFKGPNA